jgi:hypothetical protein
MAMYFLGGSLMLQLFHNGLDPHATTLPSLAIDESLHSANFPRKKSTTNYSELIPDDRNTQLYIHSPIYTLHYLNLNQNKGYQEFTHNSPELTHKSP